MARPLSEEIRLELKKTLEELGQKGVQRIRPLIPSRTLQKSLTYDVDLKKTVFKLNFTVPQYWAKFIHDGRPGIIKITGVLVWYVNPLRDDPRLRGGYPVKRSDVKKLTPGEFNEGKQKNAELYEQNPEGGKQQFMIMRNYSGPVAPSPFFDIGLKGFGNTARKAIARRIQRKLKSRVNIKTRAIEFRL